MDCKRVEEWIPLYVEGDLRFAQAGDLRAHAQTCEACGALLAQYEQSQAWLRANATPMLAGHSRRSAPRVEPTPDNALAQSAPAALPAAPIESRNIAATNEERLRIEIQTADPTIRIIWFAPKPAETDAP